MSQKHTAVGQRDEQIAFKAVCFTDGSERRGVEEQEEKGGGKIVLDVFFFYHLIMNKMTPLYKLTTL